MSQAYEAIPDYCRGGTSTGRLLGLLAFGVLGLGLGSCVADVGSGMGDEGVVALFNPAASPPVVPAPTDLIRVGGKLRVPVDPAEMTTPALKAFNDYLRTLDGYPPDVTASTLFSGVLDPNTTAEGVLVYDATDKALVAGVQVQVNANRLIVANPVHWQKGHSYLVAVLSWQDSAGLHGLKGVTGKRVLADQAFTFLRSTTPLAGHCADALNAACACSNLMDPSCHSVVDGLNDSQARQLEGARLGIAGPLTELLKLAGRSRKDVPLAFTFTVTNSPIATFDPSHAQVPFPTDALIGMDGKVALPILPGDSDAQKAIKAGLNTLDGFSTTAAVNFPIDPGLNKTKAPIALDAKTVLPQKTALLINLMPKDLGKPLQDQPLTSAQALLLPTGSAQQPTGYAAEVLVSPVTSLIGDQHRYAAVLTTDIQDQGGMNLVPAAITVLLTQSGELVKNGHSVISSVSDDDAQKLEAFRQQLQPLVQGLAAIAGLPAQKIAAVTTFRTQSIVKPLAQLTMLPAANGIPTAVTVDVIDKMLPPQLGPLAAVVHGRMTVLQVVQPLGPFNPAAAQAVQIPYMMTLPKNMGGAKVPVIIGQHGLTRWRGDMLAVAGSLAAKGMAMIAIDVIYHGARAVCRADDDCESGTCKKTGAAPAGMCTGRIKSDPLTAIPGTDDRMPLADFPGRDFTNFANPFAIRDNFRQHVIDLTQMVRVLQDGGANGLAAKLAADADLPPLDTQNLGYIGQSLGAILGTDFLAVNPVVKVGVLNVGGGRLMDIFADPMSVFSQQTGALLKGFGIAPGTAEAVQLLDTLRWILDPADPINLARNVRLVPLQGSSAKKVILQEAGQDMVIPNEWTRRLGIELGLPLDDMGHLMGIDNEGGGKDKPVSTFFAKADHGALLNFKDPALTGAIQLQAVTYLQTGLSGPPQVLPPPAK